MTSPTPTEPAEDLRGLVDMALVEHIGGQIPGIKWSTDRALDAIMALFSSRLEAAEKERDTAREAVVIMRGDPEATATYASLRARTDAAEARAQALQGQLDKAVEVIGSAAVMMEYAEGCFRDYEAQHRAKGTYEADVKAQTNRDRADALKRFREENLASIPQEEEKT